MTDPIIERKIVIGMIMSSDVLSELYPFYKSRYFQADFTRILSQWCVEHYEAHEAAPGKFIEDIFYSRLKSGKIQEDVAEEIEEDLLPDLNDDYLESGVDEKSLIKKALLYFEERSYVLLGADLEAEVERDRIEEARKLLEKFDSPDDADSGEELDFSDSKLGKKITEALHDNARPVLWYPGALGEFWNEELVEGSLIGLMAPEKRGKTYWLLDMAMRALSQGIPVAFFQAGDMTQTQQIKRMAKYRAKKSFREEDAGEVLIPVKDCVWNQLDMCDRGVRECDFGVFDEGRNDERSLRYDIRYEEILEKYRENPDYLPCYNCSEYKISPWGCSWLKSVRKSVLEEVEASQQIVDFFKKKNRKLKLSTHANGTLTIRKMKMILRRWEKQGFIPKLVLVDYGDLVEVDQRMEPRHAENYKWRSFRGLSQEMNACWVVPTQTDSKSYENRSLSLKNFSEDKRKFAHVTAMYGLNQDPEGREKKIGVMRLNRLLVRESEFETAKEVHVLQSLKIGRPFLTSYW